MTRTKILIVDDEEQIRDTMQFALQAAGHEVETAVDGTEGLAKFATGEAWDLILLDQRMPGMEGLEVLERMRERDPAARIVMVTAYGTIELAVDAMKAGAVDFLRKPFTPEVLRRAVRAVLAQPRDRVDADHPSLVRLAPLPEREPEPRIQFRTMNGFSFWHVPLPEGGEETESLRIRRAFEVRDGDGRRQPCIVELATCVREQVREETDQEFAPGETIWEALCRSALSRHLWIEAEMPPAVLTVYELTREDRALARALAGRGPVVRW